MSKLTPEIQDKICRLLRLGVPQKYAADACGIGENTFYTWMKIGKRKDSGKYKEFRESVLRCDSEALALKLAALEKAAQKGNVTAITWFLEHKHPEIFGNKLEIQHTGKIDNTIEFVFKVKDGNNSTEGTPAETETGDRRPQDH